MSKTFSLLAAAAAAAAAAGPAAVAAQTAGIKCGVATTQFQQNVPVIASAVGTKKLSFWWNWNTDTTLDYTNVDAEIATATNASFVPMLWGQAPPDSYDFLTEWTEGDVMGYNEPDLYGPACCNCDGKQTYAPATSSGWLPLFNPASAATFWQTTVNDMTSKQHQGTVLQHIVSPSMANGATPQSGVDCTLDPSVSGNPIRCEGWLSMFKTHALALDCTGFDGTATNCWDVIDALQVHAYAAKASDVLTKLDEYGSVFADDFAGTNGRSKKTLWLTEVAAASSDGAAVSSFVNDLMNTSGGLADRTKYGFVSHVSWFSEWFFPGFDVAGHTVNANEMWVSSLFNPFGGLSAVGDAFFANCAAASHGDDGDNGQDNNQHRRTHRGAPAAHTQQ